MNSETTTLLADNGAARDGADGSRWHHLIGAEWAKFWTVRSFPGLILAMALLLPAFAIAVAAAASLEPGDTIVGASLVGGATVAQVLAASLGAMLVTSEYRTGTIVPTFTACPSRARVLAVKVFVACPAVFATVLVSAAAAYAVGAAILGGSDHATGDPVQAVLGVALTLAVVAGLGVGIGAIVRHSSGAIGAVIGIVLLPAFLAPMFGEYQRWVGGASVVGVLQKLSQSADATPEAVGSLGGWPSLIVVTGYAVATVIGAMTMIRRRDV